MCADTPASPTDAPDYKDTLFLPRTDFPMRAGLPKREPGWLERWAQIGVYDKLREKEGLAIRPVRHGMPRRDAGLHLRKTTLGFGAIRAIIDYFEGLLGEKGLAHRAYLPIRQ